MGKRGMRISHGAGTASGVDLPMLKAPLVEQTWRERAACKGEPIDLFYQPRGDSENYEEAAEICQGCPVRKECLLFAIEYNENWGFWGGLSLSKRRCWLAACLPGLYFHNPVAGIFKLSDQSFCLILAADFRFAAVGKGDQHRPEGCFRICLLG